MSEPDYFADLQSRFPEWMERLSVLYFEEAEQAFAQGRAVQAAPDDFYFKVAGLRICLRFAGGELVPALTSVFAHLACGPGPADLTVLCWDNRATGGKMAPPVGAFLHGLRDNRLNGLVSNDRFAFFYHNWMHLQSGLDLASARAFYCVEEVALWPFCEQAMPMKHLLNPILNRRGLQLIHAATVGTPEGCVLITAPGGHGKSSTALAALENGLLYAADDVCAISDERTPRAFSLYETAKLREEGVGRLASFAPMLTRFEEFGEQKAFFHVHAHYPEKILREAPVRAVLYPQITGEAASRIERADRSEIMRDSLPSSLKLLPHTGKVGERMLFHLYARVPCYRLLLGTDPVQLTQVLQKLLASSAP
jgi:hypothetical protein